ncbi:MAG: cytochrome c [Hyphomicrobiales bacterium]|nr:cytochrome c [Hyphomicrobiales bacterium]
MKAIWTAILVFVALLLATYSAAADNVGDIKQGETIVREYCNSCHLTGNANARGAGAAPSFAAIAQMESTTILSIRVFLRTAHINKTMPNVMLKEDEIDAVASYILRLRK